MPYTELPADFKEKHLIDFCIVLVVILMTLAITSCSAEEWADWRKCHTQTDIAFPPPPYPSSRFYTDNPRRDKYFLDCIVRQENIHLTWTEVKDNVARARQGDAAAATLAATAYKGAALFHKETGLGAPNAESQSRYWMNFAAQGGNSDAEYIPGQESTNDKEKLRWFDRAASHGMATAAVEAAAIRKRIAEQNAATARAAAVTARQAAIDKANQEREAEQQAQREAAAAVERERQRIADAEQHAREKAEWDALPEDEKQRRLQAAEEERQRQLAAARVACQS